jgi:hypothetical protein
VSRPVVTASHRNALLIPGGQAAAGAARSVLAGPNAVAAVGRKDRSIDRGSERWEERAMWEGAGASPVLEPGEDSFPLEAGPQQVGEGYQRPGEAAVAVGLGVPGTTWQAAGLGMLHGWAG